MTSRNDGRIAWWAPIAFAFGEVVLAVLVIGIVAAALACALPGARL